MSNLLCKKSSKPDAGLEDYRKRRIETVHIKSHLETSLDYVGEEEEAEEGDEPKMDEREVVKEVGEATHIADGVKCYLRDIGKIPLVK